VSSAAGRLREQLAAAPARLPLITLYLTERCNSRCVTCDYWRTGSEHVSLERVQNLLPELERLGTSVALLSGGEPLLHPQWREIAATLRGAGIQLWLLTSGLSLAKHARPVAASFQRLTVSLDGTNAATYRAILAKHARPVAASFQRLTVSLDGTNAATYRAIRGLDAFDVVCEGIRAAVTAGLAPGLRVTVQKSNYRELPQFVRLARELGAREVSFLAVDVQNPHAFGRASGFPPGLVLDPSDLAELRQLLDAMEREFAAEFANGFIAERPQKLRRLHQYFAALQGQGAFPPVRCNAPEFSAVLGVHGELSPCFFIRGPSEVQGLETREALDAPAMRSLRDDIRAGRRAECTTCVCSLWRDPNSFANFGIGARQKA
jgi:MoaA/NifB/PqqE/SkfB family radical SAM enzyme